MNTETLFNAVCQVCECTKEEILSDSRKRYHVIARKIISACRSHDTISAVGRLLNRSHATIIYYRKIYEADIKSDALFREMMGEVEKSLNKK